MILGMGVDPCGADTLSTVVTATVRSTLTVEASMAGKDEDDTVMFLTDGIEVPDSINTNIATTPGDADSSNEVLYSVTQEL